MPVKFPHLANIGDLPFPDPHIDAQTGEFVFEQSISQRFRRSSIKICLCVIAFSAAAAFFFFPYAVGLKTSSTPRKSGQAQLVFWLSTLLIPYFSWFLSRVYTSKEYKRRITISKNQECRINDKLLIDASVIRGPTEIVFQKQKRPIESIWVQRKKRCYIIGAKDVPEDLDLIEAMIPIEVIYRDEIKSMNGFL